MSADRRSARTGLNSYVLRTSSGQYVYDPSWPHPVGFDRDSARVWLWEPEKVAAEVAAAEKRMPWAGALTAVRAR